MKIEGKCSWFGGPDDGGMAPGEPLAFIYDVSDAPYLFLPEAEEALGHNLNPQMPYVACRWDYDNPEQTREMLLRHVAVVYAHKTGKAFFAAPADWGPHEDTGRVADLSPGLLDALGIETDDVVTVIFPVIYERKFHAKIPVAADDAGAGADSDRGDGEAKEGSHLQAVAALCDDAPSVLARGSTPGSRRL